MRFHCPGLSARAIFSFNRQNSPRKPLPFPAVASTIGGVGLSLPISATLPPPPMGEVMPPSDQPVDLFHRELVQAARNLKASLARIAYYGWRMRLAEGWICWGHEPGSRGEDAYRESLGIPRSSYFKFVRIGQALHQLSLADLERIPTTNAELLIQVDPTLIHDWPWVQEARTLKPKQFADLVASRNKTVGGQEPLSTIALKVPFLAKQAIEDMLEGFQQRHELSSKGQALELMIADRQHDSNLLTAVNQARQLLEGVQKSMARRKAPEDEQTWLQMAKEILDESYEKAVQTARQKSERSQKDGGRP